MTEALEQVRLAIERAQRDGDYAKASELQYGRLPALERQVAAQTPGDAPAADGRMLKEQVDEDDIAEVVSRWTRIPVSRLLEGEVEKLLTMEARLHHRVVGQEEAIAAVANAIRRARAGLQDPARPLGSFIFLGPTGVGKTELARALAAFLFDDERALVRVDMTEYQERHTVSRLIGAPPGHVGYEEAGQLTEAVRRRPYAVVLFDEIEKAHPEVLNALLQLLDDGRLTDGKGRRVDFTHTVIIMTSNLGSQVIAAQAARGGGDLDDEVRRQVMEALRSHVRPEFLNRVDDVIFFHALDRADIRAIIAIQIRRLTERLADRRIALALADPRAGSPRRLRVRPSLRGAPVQADAAAAGARPACHADARRTAARRREHSRGRRRRQSGVRAVAGGHGVMTEKSKVRPIGRQKTTGRFASEAFAWQGATREQPGVL